MLILYRTAAGIFAAASAEGPFIRLADFAWDDLFTGGATSDSLRARVSQGDSLATLPAGQLLPPIGSQEVWAAGVTYLRSRTARMEESKQAGGSDFYDLVYHARRPELFFKASPHRVAGHGQPLRLRADSAWMVPEPELTLALSAAGELVGWTIGNDLSSRDIEGENPLYLPQAKVFDRCAGLGPGLLLTDDWPPPSTEIRLAIHRDGERVFAGQTDIGQMKQTFANLRDYLFRHNAFPQGCFLMTGTGVVPPDDFTLAVGDRVEITIEPLGTLANELE